MAWYICPMCGYQWESATLPARCPLCGNALIHEIPAPPPPPEPEPTPPAPPAEPEDRPTYTAPTPAEGITAEAPCFQAGYYWYDGSCHYLAKPPEPPPAETIPTTGNPFVDPIIGALQAVGKGFLDLLQWFGNLFKGPVEAAILGLVDGITGAMIPGSPEGKVKVRVLRLTEEYRRRLEKISKGVVSSSPDLEAAAAAADQLLGVLLGTEIVTEIASTGLDQVQAIRQMGIPDAARNIMGGLGVYSLMSELATMPARIGTLIPLEYHYNRAYTPRIPALPDLITMLVREVLTPTEYVEYASWQGESATWADRRWEAHWMLPARTWIDDALHRGIISEEEWSRFYIWHDYKPEPRPGITKSDIEILAPLRKTLIPRVDARRAWEYGHRGDTWLLDQYVKLGYEDDAPLMAEIQKGAALDGEISMVKGELVNLYQRDLIAESEFVKALEDLKTLHPRNWYWVVLARLRKSRTAKESVEVWAELSPEMEETLAEEV